MQKKRTSTSNSDELQRLRRENSVLKTKLNLSGVHDRKAAEESKGYFTYLRNTVKRHSAYKLFERASAYFSRFRLISHTLKITAFIFIAIETSAVFLIAAAIILLVIPPILLVFVIQFVLSASKYTSDTTKLKEIISQKSVICLFPQKNAEFGFDSFMGRNARELSSRGYAVIAVSPFFISGKGFGKRHVYFINFRNESEGVTSIKRQYFFFIKKKLLNAHNKRVIFIY